MDLEKKIIKQINNAQKFRLLKEILSPKNDSFYTVSKVLQFLSHPDELVVKFKTLIAISLNSGASVPCIIHQLANQLKVIEKSSTN